MDQQLQQNVRVHVDGVITNDTTNDFFQIGNVYPCPLSFSFSLDDGAPVRLKMNTMNVSDESTISNGWL